MDARGGLGGVVLTHGHADHSEAAAALAARYGAPLAAGAERGRREARRRAGASGPSRRSATPGHAPTTSRCWPATRASAATPCSARGASSSPPTRARWRPTWPPWSGSRRARTSPSSAPVTAPPCPTATPSCANTRAHRLERERALVEALDEGLRGSEELLDAAWSDVPGDAAPGGRGDARGAPRQARRRRPPAGRRGAPGRGVAATGLGGVVSGGRLCHARGARVARPRPRRRGRSAPRSTGARLRVSADRRPRLPVGLPHRGARHLRRLDRVDVPAPLRLAVGVRGSARPRCGQLEGRPIRRLRARPDAATCRART